MSIHTITTDLADSLSPAALELLTQAKAELATHQQINAKKVVKERLLEIERLTILLEKAKADLAELLQHDIPAILMLEGK
jgi:hypothetical protein